MGAPSRQLLAVWFADIVGYTTLSRADETRAIELVQLFEKAASEAADSSGGHVVKFMGDGVLACAPSASAAAEAVIGFRDQFQNETAAQGAPAYLRIGVHIGDLVRTEEGDVLGDGVNVASRLQTTAGPGQIHVSEDMWRQCRQRKEFEFKVVGPTRLKGTQDDTVVYELSPPNLDPRPVGVVSKNNTDHSIAILPFELLGGDEHAGFLASGIHNDLLTRLSKIPDLKVISRTSVMGYRGTTKPIPIIARELGVGTIMEGTVQSAGGRVRVTVQLIDAETNTHRWAEHFDRELTTEALFDIQTELSDHVAESLQSELRGSAASGPATDDLEAYRLVVEGRSYLDRKTAEGLNRAIELFEQAVESDPGYGLAWAGLADSRGVKAAYGYGDRQSLLDGAREAAARALELMPRSAEPHASLGLIAETLYDAPRAIREYETTIAHDPNHADAHSWHAWVSLVVGDGPRALASAARSVELNPLSAEAVSNLALAHLAVARPAIAVAEAIRAGELSPGYTTADYYRGLAHYDLGEFDEAVAVLTPLSLVSCGDLSTPWASMGPDASLALAWVAAGQPEEATAILESIDPEVFPFEAGLVHAGLGDVDVAFSHFERVTDVPYGPALLFHHHFRDVWQRLEGDPRLRALEERVYRSWQMEPPAAGPSRSGDDR